MYWLIIWEGLWWTIVQMWAQLYFYWFWHQRMFSVNTPVNPLQPCLSVSCWKDYKLKLNKHPQSHSCCCCVRVCKFPCSKYPYQVHTHKSNRLNKPSWNASECCWSIKKYFIMLIGYYETFQTLQAPHRMCSQAAFKQRQLFKTPLFHCLQPFVLSVKLWSSTDYQYQRWAWHRLTSGSNMKSESSN